MPLVLASNRLPACVREATGRVEFTPSPGGLAAGLRTYLASPRSAVGSEYVWVGWPGAAVPPEQQAEVAARCREQLSAAPVFLTAEEVEAFYEGFCNNTLWPLCHYFPSKVAYDETAWAAYQKVNGRFADAVLDAAGPGDPIWVHDYHLMLLPALLRRRRPKARVGFFFHIPFPAFETFRTLPDPWRRALLEGLLGADLVGFHTHDYTQHFLTCVRRILGREHEMGQIVLRDRVVRADTFPMGVAFETFDRLAAAPETARARDDLRRPLGDARIVLSIDRLDYTKGIDRRLLAYEAFLGQNPDWHGRAVLLMVVVPSRTGVEDYQRMKTRIDELVGRINGRFGTLTWTPVVYQYRSFPQEELVPLYNASAVMLVTPLRDGMNLVAKEYVAARHDGTGVLILSELAGAANELGEALVVNPNDLAGLARALKDALEMPEAEQRRRMAVLRERLSYYDVVRWAGDFLDHLRESRRGLERRLLTPAARTRLIDRFHTAAKRLILCDYDGTLVPIRPTPAEAVPTPADLDLVRRLAAAADVVMVSGRPRVFMDEWLGRLDVALVAEHGAWVKPWGGDWSRPAGLSAGWKPAVRAVMADYAGRLPGSFLEEKEFTLAWHYRLADPELGRSRARELADTLIHLTETAPLHVVEGRKVIEVRPAGVNKGVAAQPFLARGYDFVLAVGDDTTDEDLFRALPRSAVSVRVGLTSSYARFNVYDQPSLRRLLEDLAAAGEVNRNGAARTTELTPAGGL